MEENKNEVFENVQMNEQENEAPVMTEQNDTVTLFGKAIPKKPLIIASAIAVVAIVLTVTLILIFAKHPIAKFFAKMEKEENYQLNITMSDIPFFGTITMLAKYDGNVSYSSGFGEESYTERVGNVVYEYTKNSSNKWIKEKQKSEEDESNLTSDMFTAEELFNPKNYEKVAKNKYEQKDGVHFDECDNVVITLNGDTCTIEMDMSSDGMIIRTKIVVSKIGDVELVLPKV